MSSIIVAEGLKKAQDEQFWNKDIETMSRERLDALHLKRLLSLVDFAYRRSTFYRQKFDQIGLHPQDIKSLEDFKRNIQRIKANLFIYNNKILLTEIPSQYL